MTRQFFTQQNTEGCTDAQLAAFNTDLTERFNLRSDVLEG